MVLLLSSEQIELEGCACTQIKALEEWNGLIYPDNALDLTERERIAANTKRQKIAKTAKSHIKKYDSLW